MSPSRHISWELCGEAQNQVNGKKGVRKHRLTLKCWSIHLGANMFVGRQFSSYTSSQGTVEIIGASCHVFLQSRGTEASSAPSALDVA